MASPILPPIGDDLRQWGRGLTRYLTINLYKLGFKTPESSPAENGVILWDNVNGYPVVSKNGEFRQIVLEDGHADFIKNGGRRAGGCEYSLQTDLRRSHRQ